MTSACIRCPHTHTHTQPQPPGPSHPNSEDSHPISPFYPQQLGSKLHLLLQPFVCGELPETRWRRLLGRVPRSGRRFSLENLSSHVRPGEVQAQSVRLRCQGWRAPASRSENLVLPFEVTYRTGGAGRPPEPQTSSSPCLSIYHHLLNPRPHSGHHRLVTPVLLFSCRRIHTLLVGITLSTETTTDAVEILSLRATSK